MSAVQKGKDLSHASVSILVGTPTIFELYIGGGLSVRHGEEREKVLGILRPLPEIRPTITREEQEGSRRRYASGYSDPKQ